MKKIISVILAMVMSMSLLTACGGSNDANATYDVNEVMSTIESAVTMAMPMELTEEDLTIFAEIDMANVASWAGKISMANVSSDTLIVIEAAEGKVDAVKEALEGFKANRALSFERYLQDQFEKAEAGRVVVKGNYVVLAILGDNEVIINDGVEKAYEAVDAAIDEAFK